MGRRSRRCIRGTLAREPADEHCLASPSTSVERHERRRRRREPTGVMTSRPRSPARSRSAVSGLGQEMPKNPRSFDAKPGNRQRILVGEVERRAECPPCCRRGAAKPRSPRPRRTPMPRRSRSSAEITYKPSARAASARGYSTVTAAPASAPAASAAQCPRRSQRNGEGGERECGGRHVCEQQRREGEHEGREAERHSCGNAVPQLPHVFPEAPHEHERDRRSERADERCERPEVGVLAWDPGHAERPRPRAPVRSSTKYGPTASSATPGAFAE